ncbi:hypothetical protein CK505_13970 [Kocuria sp. WN036]|nr:hypothetical protein CK505_13970 [Kocuria sp. WN036]
MKYAPAFPERFGSLADARTFMADFIEAYNRDHHHAGIGLHTVADVHYGHAATVMKQRSAALATARATTPGASPPKTRESRASCRRLKQPPTGRKTQSRLAPVGLKYLENLHGTH